MTTYYYDIYGNLTTNVDPNRLTSLVPPTCTGDQVANWTGSGWVCMTPVAFTPPTPYGTTVSQPCSLAAAQASYKAAILRKVATLQDKGQTAQASALLTKLQFIV
jgi:hypothetical protein